MKSLLKYLYDAIEEREIAPVGYYIGGMKEKDLKISEDRKIIIETKYYKEMIKRYYRNRGK